MRELVLIAAILAASPAFSAPTIYPTKPGVLAGVITNNQINTKFVMDNHDDSAFYVLPPQKGYAYLTGISTASANLGFCEDMIHIQSAGHLITKKLDQITANQDAFQSVVDAAQAKVDQMQGALDAYKLTSTLASEIIAIQDSITSNQSRLSDLYKVLNTCTADCTGIFQEIRDLQTSTRNLNSTRQTMLSQNTEVAGRITQLQASLNSTQNALASANTRFADIASSKGKLLKAFKDLYSTYATLEGGTGYFEYAGDWAKQTQLLNSLNPGKNFTQVTTHDVKIDASVAGANASSLASLPAFLSSTVDGRTNDNSTITVGSYPEQFMANVRLSLTSACPITNPEAFHIGPIEAGKVKLGVSVAYQFDSAFQTQIDCRYDEKEMVKKVMSAGNSGFLFWKKSWETIDYNKVQKTTFSCKWDGLPDAALTFEQRRKFEIDAFNYAISKTLTKYATPQLDVSTPAVPSSGLSDVGKSLQTMCGATNIYCAATGWALTAIDSLFGSGQSSGSGTSTTESEVVLQWDENLLKPVGGQTNFNTDRVI